MANLDKLSEYGKQNKVELPLPKGIVNNIYT